MPVTGQTAYPAPPTTVVPPISRGIPMQEDFTGGSAGTTGTIGEHGWSVSASGGGTVTQVAGEDEHPGIRRLTTGAVDNSAVALYLGPSATAGPYISGNIGRIVKGFRPAPTGTVLEMTLAAGVSDNQNVGAAAERAMVIYDPASSAFYQCITEVAAGTETTVTTVAVTANTWVQPRIERDDSTGTWLFYINDALVATHATRKPSTSAVMPLFQVVTTDNAGVAKLLDADYSEVIPSPLTRY